MLFRQVNERIRDLERGWPSSEPIGFICECSQVGCITPVYLTTDEYAEIRSDAGSFIAAPGHIDADAERLVRRTDRYAVIRSLDQKCRQPGL
jgi:hypothetical protein